MEKLIFTMPIAELSKTEKNLWVDVRRYCKKTNIGGDLRSTRRPISFPESAIEPWISLVTGKLKGVRIKDDFQDIKNIEFVLPEQIYLGISQRTNRGLETHLKVLTIGRQRKKIEIVEDKLEKLIEKKGYSFISQRMAGIYCKSANKYSCKVKDNHYCFLEEVCRVFEES